MRILTISNCPTIKSQGSGYVIVNFCEQLRLNGHHVELFQPDDYEFAKFLRPRMNSYRIAFGMVFFVIKRLFAKKYDLVEFYGGESWISVLYIHLFYPSQEMVHHTNGPEMKYLNELRKQDPLKWYQLNQNSLYKISFLYSKRIVTVSKQDKDWLLENRIQSKENVISIHPGLPSQYLGNVTNLNRNNNFGYCGTWLPKKGIEVIMKDVPLILEKHPDSIFYLIGVGLKFEKEKFFPLNLCERIVVVPFVESKEELMKIYEKLKVFILPSIVESFGLVMAEAMACGCALVATNVGFAQELKNGEEAIIVDNSMGSFVNALD
ncbi:MAG: glycosyltransferase family 4 protein, partial [Cytophagales bacterium]|nr:glycosyltransferase family 4 protein [Cytophagales bacterium]